MKWPIVNICLLLHKQSFHLNTLFPALDHVTVDVTTDKSMNKFEVGGIHSRKNVSMIWLWAMHFDVSVFMQQKLKSTPTE